MIIACLGLWHINHYGNLMPKPVYSYIKNAANNIEQVMEAAPHKAAAVPPPTTHHENYPS